MKKIISLTLCLILCLSLFACNVEKTTVESTKESQQTENTSSSATTETTEDTSISATTETTDDTKETQQTEGTNNTQQTQATSGNTGNNADTNGDDNTETPIFFELNVENKIINIPDKKIEYISFSNNSDVTKIQNKLTIERIINAMGNMTVHEEPNPVRYFGGSIPSFNIYFSDNTYTRVLIDHSYLTLDMGPSSEPKICYAPDDRERMENLKMALGWIDIQTIGTFSIFPTIIDTEISNGTVSFSKYVKNIKITKYSHYDHDLDIPPYTISDFVMYNYEETIEEFTEVFCSLDFMKVPATGDIPNYGEYSYAKFEFYFDYGDSTFTEVRMIEYNSEIFFEINDEFYTVSDEQLELLKSAISFSI